MLKDSCRVDGLMQIGSRWYGKGSKKVLKIAKELLVDTEEETKEIFF